MYTEVHDINYLGSWGGQSRPPPFLGTWHRSPFDFCLKRCPTGLPAKWILFTLVCNLIVIFIKFRCGHTCHGFFDGSCFFLQLTSGDCRLLPGVYRGVECMVPLPSTASASSRSSCPDLSASYRGLSVDVGRLASSAERRTDSAVTTWLFIEYVGVEFVVFGSWTFRQTTTASEPYEWG